MSSLADIMQGALKRREDELTRLQQESKPQPKLSEQAAYRRRKRAWRNSDHSTADEQGFVDFPPMATTCLQMQSQYACRYVDGRMPGYPNLGKGLRFHGKNDMGYGLKIHKNDVDEFLARFRRYLRSQERL